MIRIKNRVPAPLQTYWSKPPVQAPGNQHFQQGLQVLQGHKPGTHWAHEIHRLHYPPSGMAFYKPGALSFRRTWGTSCSNNGWDSDQAAPVFSLENRIS